MNPLDIQIAQLRAQLIAIDAQRDALLDSLSLLHLNRGAIAKNLASLEAQRPPDPPKE